MPIAIFALLICGTFIWAGIKGFQSRIRNIKNCTTKIQGIIIENEENIRYTHNEKPRPYSEYIPAISYDYEGKNYRYICENGYSTKPRALGRKIDILINPTKPEEAFVPKWEDTGIMLFVICIFVGLICGGIIVFQIV